MADGGVRNPSSRGAVCEQHKHGSVGAGAGNRPGYPTERRTPDMLETSTNGAAADGAAVGREDQGGVAELGFVAGGRVAPAGVPDPELVAQAKRRSFTAKYKLEILAKADACTRPGEVGELLRREGLYTSHLTYWRKQVRDGALKELGQPRGRKPVNRRDQEIAVLRRRAERAEAELVKARKVIEIQGNLSALLEQMLDTESASASGSTER